MHLIVRTQTTLVALPAQLRMDDKISLKKFLILAGNFVTYSLLGSNIYWQQPLKKLRK